MRKLSKQERREIESVTVKSVPREKYDLNKTAELQYGRLPIEETVRRKKNAYCEKTVLWSESSQKKMRS